MFKTYIATVVRCECEITKNAEFIVQILEIENNIETKQYRRKQLSSIRNIQF